MSQAFTAEFWAEFIRNASVKAIHAGVSIVFILLLLVLSRYLLLRIVGRMMAAMVERQATADRPYVAARSRTLIGLMRSVISYTLVLIAGIMILRSLGADPVPLLTTAGVLGLAVGFGAQKLVRDVITGFFILLENQYTVGDYITLANLSGTVEDVGMRSTRLRDEIGRLIIVANGDVTTVVNHSRGPLLGSVEVSVASSSDIVKVREVLLQVGSEIAKDRSDVYGAFTCDGLLAMDGLKITVRLVGKVDPKSLQDVQMDLRARVRDALIANDITIV